MNWSTVSNISSISTLILFVIYFVGRFWNIMQSKNEIQERFDREHNPDFKIVDYFHIGDDNSDVLYFTAGETLLSVKVYECSLLPVTGKLKMGKLHANLGPLKNGFTFKIETFLPEGFPMLALEYIRNDFTKGIVPLVENLRTGIIEQETYKEHTFKSVLYYLFK